MVRALSKKSKDGDEHIAGAARRGRGSKPTAKAKGKRFVFIVGDEGSILVFMNDSKVVRRLFAPSAQPSHTEAMRELMVSNPSVPVYLLADVLDQQYIPHSFPPVSALSVGGLVKRRLDRDFQPDDLKGSLPLGRDKAGRKEWRYMLIALAKTPLMTEWISLLVDLPNEMKGIYLSPIEAVNYVSALHKALSNERPQRWQLLISFNKVSGFRQVVTCDGKLKFTRVSQAIDDAIPAVIAGNIEQEIINTMEYLKRLEFRDNAELEATIVVAQDVGESIDMRRFGFGGARVLSPLQVAEALGLEQAALSADRFGDVVMAAAFGIIKKHTLRFSTSYIDKLSKLYTVRRAVRAASILVSLLFLGLAGLSVVGVISDYGDISTSEKKVADLQPDLRKFRTSVEGLNKDVSFKSAVVATYDAYIDKVPQPNDFAKDIIPFVAPAHRITSFSWVYSDKPAGAGAQPNALPLDVATEFDFSGAGATVPLLSKAAGDLLAEMKAKLTQYDITPEPFPWLKDEVKEEQITLEITQAAKVSEQNMITKIGFRGVKKVATPAPAAPAPAPNAGQP